MSNILNSLTLAINGGKGSGNFGHSGRPGLVGGAGKGSGSSSKGSSSKTSKTKTETKPSEDKSSFKVESYRAECINDNASSDLGRIEEIMQWYMPEPSQAESAETKKLLTEANKKAKEIISDLKKLKNLKIETLKDVDKAVDIAISLENKGIWWEERIIDSFGDFATWTNLGKGLSDYSEGMREYLLGED